MGYITLSVINKEQSLRKYKTNLVTKSYYVSPTLFEPIETFIRAIIAGLKLILKILKLILLLEFLIIFNLLQLKKITRDLAIVTDTCERLI